MNIQQVRFIDAAFERCIEIRLAVFVEEQNVPLEEERDEYDATALHFLATEDDTALATARVILKNNGASAKIGRVAVRKPARGCGIGAALIRHIEHEVPAAEYLLDAQSHALAFYERLGYVAYGDEFMDAGIPHFHMRKIVSTRGV
jgi:predicted GNAT family N-acyltransferase